MGFAVTIGGYPFQAEDYNVTEEATPLAAGDSQGGTGTISITLQPNDGDAFAEILPTNQDVYGDRTYGDGVYGFTSGQVIPQRPLDTGWGQVFQYGPLWFIDKDVKLADSRKGFTIGKVLSAQRNDSGGTVTITCATRLYDLNVYGVQAQPYVGTLRGAFVYYLGLANYDGDYFIDTSISERPVVFPGWTGELWFHLKEMAVSQDCDISLVSGVILLRPIRARVATRGRDVDRTYEIGGGTLAQSVEVYYQNSKAITNQLVYPPGGWKPETEVLNVNAGEEAEYVLELSASVSAIQTPTMQTFVAEDFQGASVYTVVANDGLPIPVQAWQQNGGSVQITVEPDTTRLRVKLRGAMNLPTSTGEAATNFALALASDTTGNRYSTLRIVGTGVAYDKQKLTVRTMVPASKTATEVGVTVDNIFINTLNDAYRAGTRAAKRFSGYAPSLSGTVTAINRRGDSGTVILPSYARVDEVLNQNVPSPTYATVKTYIRSTLGNTTYREDGQYWFSLVQDSSVNQVFGNVQGCRVFDKKSRRWYRIRSGTLTPPTIQQFTADDDHVFSDVEEFFLGRTYASVQSTRTALTYRQDQMAGLLA